MDITADGSGGSFEFFYDPATAAVMQIKCNCVIALVEAFRKSGMTQAEFGSIIGARQSRVSDIMTASLAKFSADWLIAACSKAGIEWKFTLDVPESAE